MRLARYLPILFVLTLPACDSALLNSDCRSIGSSGYSLCRDQNGSVVFYVEPTGRAPSGGGILDGTVQWIGWNDRVIIADRKAIFGGDPDGLMVLDLASKNVAGPFDRDSVAQKYPSIKLSEPADAWEILR